MRLRLLESRVEVIEDGRLDSRIREKSVEEKVKEAIEERTRNITKANDDRVDGEKKNTVKEHGGKWVWRVWKEGAWHDRNWKR